MKKALAAMDRAAMFRFSDAHKALARHLLRGMHHAPLTHRAHRIIDRWWRLKAHSDPLGKFYHGSTYEEPRVSWRGLPEVKYIPLFRPGEIS